MEYWSIYENTHLVGTEIEKDLKAVDRARSGLRGRCHRKLEFRWNGFSPLKNLVVEITNLFDLEDHMRRGTEGTD